MGCDTMEFLKAHALCGVCRCPVRTSEYMNVVTLDKIATWEFPTSSSFYVKGDVKHATSLVCDGCIGKHI